MRKKNPEKQEVLMEFGGFVDKYSLEGDIIKVAEYIKSLPAKVLEQYPLNNDLKNAHRFSIRVGTETEYYSSDSHDVYDLLCYRWETDEELAKRLSVNLIKSEAAKRAAITKSEAKIKREKTLYENLKKKFESKK